MYTETKLLTLVALMDEQNAAMMERERQLLRAAEAHHRSWLLREGQMAPYVDTRDTRCAAFWSNDDRVHPHAPCRATEVTGGTVR